MDPMRFYAQCAAQCLTRPDRLFLNHLFLSAVDIAPFQKGYSFDCQLLPTMAYLAWYGRHLNVGERVNKTNVLVASWADLMGSIIAPDRILAKELARKALTAAVKALIQDNVVRIISKASEATYTAQAATDHGRDWAAVKTGDPVAAAAEPAMRILSHLADQADKRFSKGVLSTIVHVYLATIKRGTVSEWFSEMITADLSADLQIANLTIDADACREFYSIFLCSITGETAQRLITHCMDILPVSALRFRMRMAQSPAPGITALSVTGRALKIYVDFNWTRIREIYLCDWTNFEQAVRLVGDNQWYGLRDNLGTVSSIRYKNLSYVAKELLIRVNGETKLRKYAGWTRKPMYQGVVDNLIAEYEKAKAENVAHQIPMPVIDQHPDIAALREAIIQGGAVYL